MATPVIMPRQGQSVESCIIGKWHKKQGDSVAVGDLLFTYETDKAIFDEAATVAGILLAVFFEEGDDVPCLTNVCVIGQPGEDVSVYHPDSASKDQESEKSQVLPEKPRSPCRFRFNRRIRTSKESVPGPVTWPSSTTSIYAGPTAPVLQDESSNGMYDS